MKKRPINSLNFDYYRSLKNWRIGVFSLSAKEKRSDNYVSNLCIQYGLYDLFCYNFTPLAKIFTPPPEKITPLNYGLVQPFHFRANFKQYFLCVKIVYSTIYLLLGIEPLFFGNSNVIPKLLSKNVFLTIKFYRFSVHS